MFKIKKESVYQQLNKDHKMLTGNKEETELLNSYFDSSSATKICFLSRDCKEQDEGTGLKFATDKNIFGKYLFIFKYPGQT